MIKTKTTIKSVSPMPIGQWDAADGVRIIERARVVNRTIPPASVQDGLSVSDQTVPLQPFEFLAKYFSLTALMAAESRAVSMGQEQAAGLFRKAVDRTTWVGAKRL